MCRKATPGERDWSDLEGRASPDHTRRPMSPPSVDRIVKKCLAKDPDGRWQSAHDLRDELQWTVEAGSQLGALTAKTSAPQQAWWRRAMPWPAGMLLGGFVIGLGVWSLTAVETVTAPLISRFAITPPKTAPSTTGCGIPSACRGTRCASRRASSAAPGCCRSRLSAASASRGHSHTARCRSDPCLHRLPPDGHSAK